MLYNRILQSFSDELHLYRKIFTMSKKNGPHK